MQRNKENQPGKRGIGMSAQAGLLYEIFSVITVQYKLKGSHYALVVEIGFIFVNFN